MNDTVEVVPLHHLRSNRTSYLRGERVALPRAEAERVIRIGAACTPEEWPAHETRDRAVDASTQLRGPVGLGGA